MKPTLFNTEMVRALLKGQKTVTRRVVKPQPKGRLVPELPNSCWPGYFAEEGTPRVVRPPYFPGEILYVRETWCDPSGTGYPFLYKADMPMHWDAEDTEIGVAIDLKAEDYTWRPSIHMPQEAARIFLRVTDVRVERLHDIRGDSCVAEGASLYFGPAGGREEYYRSRFAELWDSTIKPADHTSYGWEVNPWVWVIEFERISAEEAKKGDRI